MTNKRPPKIGDEKVESAFMRVVKPDKELTEDIEKVSIKEPVISIEHFRLRAITMRGVKINLLGLVVVSLTLALASVGCFILWLNAA